MRTLSKLLPWLLLVAASTAQAGFSDDEIRIGLITDLRGMYSDIAGQGAVIAAEMAIEDYGGRIDGRPIRLLVADHQNDAEVALREAERLHREHGVDVFAEMVSSNTAIAIQRYAREHGLVTLHSGAASSVLTGAECSPTGVHWAYDTVALARGTVSAMLAEGARNWFFLTSDYPFGHTLEADAREVLHGYGISPAGNALHRFRGTDFSSELLSAQRSGADVIALANAGGDTRTAVRQAYELGVIQDGQELVGLLLFITDIRSLGLYVAGGLKMTTGFYWDYDEQTRAWSERFQRRAGSMPTMVQASVYSSLQHYFKAADAAGTDAGPAVVAKMRELPVEDFFARNGRLREDGRLVHDMYLVEVKRAVESRRAWDYLRVIRSIPGDEAFRALADSDCPYLQR